MRRLPPRLGPGEDRVGAAFHFRPPVAGAPENLLRVRAESALLPDNPKERALEGRTRRERVQSGECA